MVQGREGEVGWECVVERVLGVVLEREGVSGDVS